MMNVKLVDAFRRILHHVRFVQAVLLLHVVQAYEESICNKVYHSIDVFCHYDSSYSDVARK